MDVDWKYADGTFRKYPKAKRYRDFREMLDKDGRNIDAVTVSTPDHTHAAVTLAALRAGKHVYTQKPLCRTLGEVRAVMDEARRRPKQATQMGNQGHAGEGIRLIREWVEAGLIGTPREIQPPVKYPRTEGVYAEWIAACKAGTQGGSAFATSAGPLAEMVRLGNLAVRAQRTIELDAQGRVTNAAIPAEWITPAYRPGWSL